MEVPEVRELGTGVLRVHISGPQIAQIDSNNQPFG
jgi:hypothetical protein